MEISKLFGKPKTYTIGGQEFIFQPLEMVNIGLLVNMGNKEKQGEAIKELVIATFKRSYPELKEEEINKISLEYFEDITKAILDVNNIEAPKGQK